MPSKKEFELTAAILSHAMAAGFDRKTVIAIASRFADKYAAANPRFNSARFLTACGVE